MDNPRERFLASLLGGFGTVVGLFIYQGIPDLIRLDFLQIRVGNFFLFLAVTFLLGMAGGYGGHRMFMVTAGTFRKRAIVVGALTGLAIAVLGWTVTFYFRDALFPFRLFEGVESLLFSYLRNALIAGPIGGILVSLSVARWLHKRGISDGT
ncbi:MAG: hypothetical protein KY429_11080 [Actinobacteria bacterium]|nr:hypothetical protein [Actinomycetota bacterium]